MISQPFGQVVKQHQQFYAVQLPIGACDSERVKVKNLPSLAASGLSD